MSTKGLRHTINKNSSITDAVPAQPNGPAVPSDKSPGTTVSTSPLAVLSLQDVWKFAESVAAALQDYAKSGDISYMLVVQRKLVRHQDDNGDKWVTRCRSPPLVRLPKVHPKKQSLEGVFWWGGGGGFFQVVR